MKKRHEQHFRVLSLIEDSLLFEVDEWRERALSRLMAEKDPTVAVLTREGEASFKKKRRKGLTFFLLATLLLLGAMLLVFLLRGCEPSTEVPPPVHIHSLTHVTQTPTCTEGGYTEEYCTDGDCDYRLRTEEYAPTGHVQGAPVRKNEIAADCTREGSYEEEISCTACTALLSQRTVTLPSTHGVRTLLHKSGDCTTGAYYVIEECLDCGERSAREDLAASPKRSTRWRTASAPFAVCPNPPRGLPMNSSKRKTNTASLESAPAPKRIS